MSKKKSKMVAQEFATVDIVDGAPVESPVRADPEATMLEKAEDAGAYDVRADVKAKLETLEKTEKALADMAKENAALKDKLAEYVEEIEALRAGEGGAAVDRDAELKALRDENDSYLMKISELTFENAKLKAEAAETAKKAAGLSAKPVQRGPTYANVYRNAASANGYSSWN